jgi:hypothetical protein
VLATLLGDNRVRLRAVGYNQAPALWASRNIEHRVLTSENLGEALADSFGDGAVKLVLAGTSANDMNWEKLFVARAREVGLPSLAVLDHWSNYRLRFADEEGRLRFVPDKIAIMDRRARKEMITEGFQAETLVVTGHPAFDDLRAWKCGFTEEKRQAIRAEAGVDSRGQLITFVSQPISTVCRTDESSPLYLGYDEREVLALVLNGLQRLQDGRAPITVAVRPHPREDPAWVRQVARGRVGLMLATQGHSRDWVLAADLVVGMDSVLLMEACYLGCLVLSVQPRLRTHDSLPTNASGHSKAVYDTASVLPALGVLLFDDEARKRMRRRLDELRPSGEAAREVAQLAYSMMGEA